MGFDGLKEESGEREKKRRQRLCLKRRSDLRPICVSVLPILIEGGFETLGVVISMYSRPGRTNRFMH